jgi:hypothetical protein
VILIQCIFRFEQIGIRGRCYDHNFLRFLPIFGEKNWRFSQKNNLMINFLKKLAVVWKKANILAKFFRRKYFKNHIIGPRSPTLSTTPGARSWTRAPSTRRTWPWSAGTISQGRLCPRPSWLSFRWLEQGCQMVFFNTKNPNLGKFWTT